MWGYVQHAAAATTPPACRRVAAHRAARAGRAAERRSGLRPGRGAAAQQPTRRNVLLGYHLSFWGTGVDIPSRTRRRATSTASPPRRPLLSLARAHFDLTFTEFSDRDAGFKQVIYGDGGASWWKAGRLRAATSASSAASPRAAHQAIAIWQIPLGNTEMRAENNTFGHFQDNRVQWLLGKGGERHLRQYARRGRDRATCLAAAPTAPPAPATPPRRHHRSARRSTGTAGARLSADDDGGLFRELARRFYHRRALGI